MRLKRPVYIIARCINRDNANAASLVLDTIRVGFPTNPVYYIYSGDFGDIADELKLKCSKQKVEFCDWSNIDKSFSSVVSSIFNMENNDFIICHSDMVFHSDLEWYNPHAYVSGMLIPTHYNELIKCIIKEMLHSSLMYFSFIQELKTLIQEAEHPRIAGGIHTPNIEWFKPFTVFENSTKIFYDVATNLCQAFQYQAFDDNVTKCYTHLFCGSYREEIKNLESYKPIIALHNQYLK